MRPNRFGEQSGDDRRIDAAREAADDSVRADSFTHLGDRFVSKIPQAPSAGRFADLTQEIAEDFFAIDRVGHFRVELKTINGKSLGAYRRERAGRRTGERLKIIGELLDLIAVAHPDFRLCRNAHK